MIFPTTLFLLLFVSNSFSSPTPSPVGTAASLTAPRFSVPRSFPVRPLRVRQNKVCPISATRASFEKSNDCDWVHVGWHGTDAKFQQSIETCVKPVGGRGCLGPGFYLTDRYEIAAKYADRDGHDNPIVCAIYASRTEFLSATKVALPDKVLLEDDDGRDIFEQLWFNRKNIQKYISHLKKTSVIPAKDTLMGEEVLLTWFHVGDFTDRKEAAQMVVPSTFTPFLRAECRPAGDFDISTTITSETEISRYVDWKNRAKSKEWNIRNYPPHANSWGIKEEDFHGNNQ